MLSIQKQKDIKKIKRLLQMAEYWGHKNNCKGLIDWASNGQVYLHGYVEPGCSTDRAIVAHDWNDIQELSQDHGWVSISAWPHLIERALESAGIEVVWSESWFSCDECEGIVTSNPQSAFWNPSYVAIDGEILCLVCKAKKDKAEQYD